MSSTSSSSSEYEDEETPTSLDARKSSGELRRKLLEGLQWSEFEKTNSKFLPAGIVEQLVDETAIKTSLRIQDPSPEQAELISFIIQQAKTTFAIVVFGQINANIAMRWFKTNGYSDKKLPILIQDKTWRKSWRQDFYDHQWKFTAPVFPVFDQEVSSGAHSLAVTQFIDLNEAHVLPFIEKGTDNSKGSFGQVTRYVLHKDHAKPPLLSHTSYAIKFISGYSLAQEAAEDWGREVRALRVMNQLDQSHIVRLIAAFRRRKRDRSLEHYLVFEWADKGSLRDFWKANPSPMLTCSMIKNAIKQILGLATAIHAIRTLNETQGSYSHGNLKPENILCFKGEGQIGTLKIGDWGEALFHDDHQVAGTDLNGTKSKHGTRRYEAPHVEIDVQVQWLGQSRWRQTRPNDVWAIGCVALEFVVWVLYGPLGLCLFESEIGNDQFHISEICNGRTIASVHPAAVRWMEILGRNSACHVGNTALGDLLEIIKTALLVVKLPGRLSTGLPEVEVGRYQADFGSASFTLSGEATPILRHGDHSYSDGPTSLANGNSPITVNSAQEQHYYGQDQNFGKILAPEPEGPVRCQSRQFKRWMEQIFRKSDTEDYWKTNGKRYRIPLDLANSNTFLPSKKPTEDFEAPDLDENDWKPWLDNEFARTMFKQIENQNIPTTPPTSDLQDMCNTCQAFVSNLRHMDFETTYDIATLAASAETHVCRLCALFLRIYKLQSGSKSKRVRIEKIGHVLKMNGGRDPVLTLVHHPDEHMDSVSECQIGLVEMTDAASPFHLSIIRHWLKDCDNRHIDPPTVCRNQTSMSRPTRLLDVGHAADDLVYLREAARLPADCEDWIALSHPWGERKYCTTRLNIETHLQGIAFGDLPSTFVDAIKVTRALGKRYLWIDSLCIIQGKYGDFADEAKCMEDVYSGAYCVIAASAATDHFSGFLKARNRRDYVGLPPQTEGQSSLYICQNIDDFKGHVLDSALNRRGWVLQEHALARRTLFFTEHQTYFECGCGVRCETSTKFRNEYASLLGDPEFPRLLYDGSSGAKILRILGLFSKYSRLGLTRDYDRPVAIAGLQKRLQSTIEVGGDFGILDARDTRGLLRRTLLWRRGLGVSSIKPIDFPNSKGHPPIPSWSWMAYNGGIDYLNLGFDHWDWGYLQSPWNQQHERKIAEVDLDTSKITLVAYAQAFNLDAASGRELELYLDNPERLQSKPWCAVLGKAKNPPNENDHRHCVLLVSQTLDRKAHSNRIHKRIGVAIVPGRCLSQDTEIIFIQ